MAASDGRKGRPWRRLREQVLREEPYCTVRGLKCTGLSTDVDHILPLSRYPHLAHVRSNLRGVCGWDNGSKGSRLPSPPPRTHAVTRLQW